MKTKTREMIAMHNMLIDGGFDIKLYQSLVEARIGESYDKIRAKDELIGTHSKIKEGFEETNFHIRSIVFPDPEIDLRKTYTIKETANILKISKSQVRELIKYEEIKARRHNARVIKPYQSSVNAFALGMTDIYGLDQKNDFESLKKAS